MSTIKLFNKALAGKEVNYSNLCKLGLKVGYLIHPDCATREVENFLNAQIIDYNSTFYKSWNDVISRSREEIWVDQIISYIYGYGLNLTVIPNDNSEQPDFTEFRVINPIAAKDATARCEQMLYSGIALKQDTIEDILVVLSQLNYQYNISKIKNKEAKMWIYKATSTLPADPVEMVRYLVFLASGKSLLIKDKETINALKSSALDVTQLITLYGTEKLASVFLRYKVLFLAFKANKSKLNSTIINQLRKSAIKNHQPMKTGFWENILDDPSLLGQMPDRINEINNFKKITLIEAINVRLTHSKINTFPIRNGKIWLSENLKQVTNQEYLKLLKNLLYRSIIESLKPKATTIKLPNGVDIKLPKSEKSFVGNYPLGSSVEMAGKDLIIGINWRESNGLRDLDLKMIDIEGVQFGWNALFKNNSNSVIYSGDMVTADPESTELFYAGDNNFKPSIIKVNMYSGNLNSKFKFFLASEKIIQMTQSYSVDPNSVIFQDEEQMDSREKSLGILLPNKFIFASFRTGNKNVAGDSVTNQYIQYTLDTLDCYLPLKQLLEDAGFEIVKDKAAQIDLTDLSKDSLIELLS